MIRSALLALGLSVSSLVATALNAQVMVGSEAAVETCGSGRMVSERDGAGYSDPHVGSADLASAENNEGEIEVAQAAASGKVVDTAVTRVELAALQVSGVWPFGLNVIDINRVNGSDPSAGFCP